MNYLLRHMVHQACNLVGILVVIFMFSACSSWQEAKDVIALADSLDQAEHVIYDDTAALGQTIRRLDNPVGRLLMSNTLGKAHYYMGRNLSLSNHIAEAAEHYISADRLQIADPIYRGRINSCMGYICAQNNNDSLALIFYERAHEDFVKSGNEWRYAQSLLNVSLQTIELHQFNKADSILRIAQTYHLDSAYQARFYETLGLYFYEQQQHDSALVYFQEALDYWQTKNDKCFSWLKMMQVYLAINDLTKALPYSQLILETSNNPNYISNAYFCLIQNAKQEEDVDLVSEYASSREDMNRLLEVHKESYTQAVVMLEDYNNIPYPFRWAWLTIVSFFILCILLITAIYIYRKITTTQLNISNEQIVSLSTHIKKQKNELDKHHAQHYYDERLDKIRRKYPIPLHQWNKYEYLKKDINPYLQNWLVELEKLRLTNRENVFCVLTFIYPQMSADELANHLCITKEALLVRKTRVAKKIGVTSAQLSNFFQNLTNIT